MLKLALPVCVATAALLGSPGTDATVLFRGRVLARETLQPVVGARVHLAVGSVQVLTDERGAFTFPIDKAAFGRCERTAGGGIGCSFDDPARMTIYVDAPGFVQIGRFAGSSHDWKHEATLFIARSASVVGRWLDVDDRPVLGRGIRVASSEWARTDVEGRFEIGSVQAGIPLTFMGSHDEAVDLLGSDPLVLLPGELRQVELRSRASRRIAGVVRNPAGDRVAGADVWLVAGSDFLTGETNEDGQYSFDNVPIGDWELRAFHPTSYDHVEIGRHLALKVTPGSEDLLVDLNMERLARITGRVVDSRGQPAGGGEVCIHPETMPYSGSADVEEDGSFVLPEVFQGEARLMAYDSERLRRSAEVVVRSNSKTVELVLEPGFRVRGRISPAELDPEAQVFLEMRLEGGRKEAPDLSLGWTGPEAELTPGEAFDFSEVPAGRWRIVAYTKTGRVSAEQVIDLGSEAEVACPDLVLEPSVELLLIAAPGMGACDVEVVRGDVPVAKLRLPAYDALGATVPAGVLHTITRTGDGRILKSMPRTLAPGDRTLVGIGW